MAVLDDLRAGGLSAARTENVYLGWNRIGAPVTAVAT